MKPKECCVLFPWGGRGWGVELLECDYGGGILNLVESKLHFVLLSRS